MSNTSELERRIAEYNTLRASYECDIDGKVKLIKIVEDNLQRLRVQLLFEKKTLLSVEWEFSETNGGQIYYVAEDDDVQNVVDLLELPDAHCRGIVLDKGVSIYRSHHEGEVTLYFQNVEALVAFNKKWGTKLDPREHTSKQIAYHREHLEKLSKILEDLCTTE